MYIYLKILWVWSMHWRGWDCPNLECYDSLLLFMFSYTQCTHTYTTSQLCLTELWRTWFHTPHTCITHQDRPSEKPLHSSPNNPTAISQTLAPITTQLQGGHSGLFDILLPGPGPHTSLRQPAPSLQSCSLMPVLWSLTLTMSTVFTTPSLN